MKTYKIGDEQVTIEVATYAYPRNERRKALQLKTTNGELYAYLSVNIPDDILTNDNCFFVDNNNCPCAERFLQDSGIATPTGRVALSGFWVYPEYELLI